MKYYFTLITAGILAFTISCNQSKNESDVHISPVETSESVPPQDSLTIEKEPTVQSVPAAANPLLTVNPPHGEPGHRCDIPVGASLSSAPATVQQPATTVVTPTVTPEPSQSISSLPSGTPNPPHGEPGHRCEIPVGQALP